LTEYQKILESEWRNVGRGKVVIRRTRKEDGLRPVAVNGEVVGTVNPETLEWTYSYEGKSNSGTGETLMAVQDRLSRSMGFGKAHRAQQASSRTVGSGRQTRRGPGGGTNTQWNFPNKDWRPDGFEGWSADQKERFLNYLETRDPVGAMRSSTAVADPDFPHPALTQISHAEYTEMVPIEFFDEMPGNIQGQMDRDDRLVAAPAGVFRDFEKDAPIILQMTDDLTEDIRSNGIKNALMVNYNPQTGDVNLEEGNHRLIAARRLGMTHVPVRMNRTTVEREGIRGPRKQIGGMRKNERYEHLDLGGEYLGSAFKPSQVGVPTRPKKGGGTRGMRSERTRVDEPRPSPFDDEVARLDQAAATMRAAAGRGPLPPRITQADKQRMVRRDPKQNLQDLDAAIDEYVAFLGEHHRHDFSGDPDAISAIDDAHPGLVNRHDRHKDRLNEIASFFEEERASLEEARFEQGAVQDELNSLTKRFDRANAGNSQRRRMNEAMSQGRQRDEFLAAEVGDLAVNRDALDPTGPAATWRAVEEERKEILELERKLKELQRKTEAHPNGTESVLKQFRERVQAKLSKHQRPDKVLEIGKGNEALNPGQGMRSRRDALSDHNKEWLRLLQANPAHWDDAPAAVRNVASDQLRQQAMRLRASPRGDLTGMRSTVHTNRKLVTHRAEVIGKVKPEHRGKQRPTLYYVGGAVGVGKSSIARENPDGRRIQLPDPTQAAHIDIDEHKRHLDGFDPNNPMPGHNTAVRSADTLHADAAAAGIDVVYQSTGKRVNPIQTARDRGDRVVGHFVWAPDSEIEQRVADRHAAGGIRVDSGVPTATARDLRNGTTARQITDGLYDEFYLWDNRGRTPRLIAYRTEDGQFAIHGRQEFDAFFGESGKHVERYWQKNR
jgi:predicted ABC-type ATPase